MAEFLNGIRAVFSGWTIFFYLVFYTLVGGGYFYIISSDAVWSIVVGVIGSFIFFYSFNVLQERMNKRNEQMNDINNYVTTLVFYLKTGKNVLDALEDTYEVAGDSIKDDIKLTIDTIIEDGEIKLDHFEKYSFTALDIFHNNLEIKFTQGGNSHDIFQNTTRDINFEISKRDQLKRNKEYVVKQEYASAGLVLAIPAIIALMTGTIYEQYLNTGIIALLPISIFHFAIVGTIYFLRKKQVDVEVSL